MTRCVLSSNFTLTVPDPWLTKKSWLTKTDVTYDIKFKGMTVKSRMYDIDVIGYNNTSNKLHLFDIESVDESIVEDGININKEDIKKNLTLFLYPDDSDEAGRILRIYQQYFMVSSAANFNILFKSSRMPEHSSSLTSSIYFLFYLLMRIIQNLLHMQLIHESSLLKIWNT